MIINDFLLPAGNGKIYFIGLKQIISNPTKDGFVFDKEDLYTLSKTKIVEVNTAISNIASFAKKVKIIQRLVKRK